MKFQGFISVCLILSFLSCQKDEIDTKVNYIYSNEILDAATLQERQAIIDSETKQATTQENMNGYLEYFQALEYDQYDGVVPQYEFKLPTKTVLSSRNFKTIVVGDNDDARYNVIYVHGGAYAFPIAEEHLSFIEDVAGLINANVYVPLYPMLPRWNHSDAIEMILEVYAGLLEQGRPVILMGDSAGGNIMLGFTFFLKSNGYAMPAYLVGLSPAMDMAASNPKMDAMEQLDIYIDRTVFMAVSKKWAGTLSLEDPVISPLFGDPTGFPPTLLYVGDQEILYPDIIDFAEKCASCGVKTTVCVGKGLWHVAPLSDIPVSELFKNCIVSFVK